MTAIKMYKKIVQVLILVAMSVVITAAYANDVLSYLTNKDGAYIGPSLEDNVVAMDTDKNGFADVYEVRAFLELKHGKGYQKEVLDKMEASASGKSCSTPFAKDLYIDKSNKDKNNKLESYN